jgi:hypothetical protein
MKRRKFVEQSVPALLSDPRIDGKISHFVFVDHYCPEASGSWVNSRFRQATVFHFSQHAPLKDGRVPIFNKPIAQNAGALEAINLGAQYLAFLDADTIVTQELLDYVFANASPDRFMVFAPNEQWKDLTGFIVVPTRAFVRVNGFNKDFRGWGAEDLELRLHLFLKGKAPLNRPRAILKDPLKYGMRWLEMPVGLAKSIPHDDSLRVANYEEKDKNASHDLNLNLLCSNVYNWLGVHPVDLHDTPLGFYIRRLLGMDLLINPRAIE